MTAVVVALAALLPLLAAALLGDGRGPALDESLLVAAADARAPWLDAVVVAVTTTAGWPVVVPAVAAVLVLLRRGEVAAAGVMAASAALGPLVAPVLKPLVGRARPDVVEHVVTVQSLSFPSGHTLTAAGTYGMLALLLLRRGHPWLAAGSALWVVAVGASRTYLGVHHPTDVLAGLALGLLLVLALGRLDPARRRPAAVGPGLPQPPVAAP